MSRAVILAGGLGTRLRPYTTVLPKALMPVGDRPVLDIIVRQLQRGGFDHVTIATGHLAELIEVFFGDGSRYGLRIDYLREETPLGTIGALPLIEGLDGDFVVINGDVLSDLDHRALLESHSASGYAATIATRDTDIELALGVVHLDDPQDPVRLTGYSEKPHFQFEVSMGIYAFSPRVLEHISAGDHVDFPDLVRRLIDAEERVRAWRTDGYWLDIGHPEDYERAIEEFERMRPHLLGDT